MTAIAIPLDSDGRSRWDWVWLGGLAAAGLIWVLTGLQFSVLTSESFEVDLDCPNADNTPGGADGQGGCFPYAGNTGPTGSLTTYSGPCTITVDDTVINSKIVNCNPLNIEADNVTLSNCQLNGQLHEEESDGHTGFQFIDCVLDATPVPDTYLDDYGFDFEDGGYVILRSEIYGARTGVNCFEGGTIQDSYIHGNEVDPTDFPAPYHSGGIRVEHDCHIEHNTITCDFGPPTPGEGGCSGSTTGYPDFGIMIRNSYINNLYPANQHNPFLGRYGDEGGSEPFASDPDNATHTAVINNVFGKGVTGFGGTFGGTTAFRVGGEGNSWSGNKWDDGTTVDPNE